MPLAIGCSNFLLKFSPLTIKQFQTSSLVLVIQQKKVIGTIETVEDKIESDYKEVALVQGLFRLVSLKHDFPDAFYKLLNPRQGNNQKTEFVVGKNFFEISYK